jgi:hypothetical protein
MAKTPLLWKRLELSSGFLVTKELSRANVVSSSSAMAAGRQADRLSLL